MSRVVNDMTIDEAIAKYKEITNTDTICPIYCNISCDKCVKESQQLAEWLEELKVYQQHEIICNKGYNVGYNNAISECLEIVKFHRNSWDGIEAAIKDIEELIERLQ